MFKIKSFLIPKLEFPRPWREADMLPSSLLPPSWGEIIRKGRGIFSFTLTPTLSHQRERDCSVPMRDSNGPRGIEVPRLRLYYAQEDQYCPEGIEID
jgi:hypothetical protein